MRGLLGRLGGAANEMPQEAYRSKMAQPLGVRDSLLVQKQELERRLKNVNETIEALDKNPGVAEVVEKLAELGL